MPKVPTPGKVNKSQAQPNQRTEEKEVKNAEAAQASQAEAKAEAPAEEPQRQADYNEVLSQVSDSERSAPDEPLTEAELEGLALTAKMNKAMPAVFSQEEYSGRMGVFNEPNRVENVPADSVITWATPEWIDQGMHLNWLLTTGGHRLVHPREVSKARDGRGIFIPGLFDARGEQVEQNGAVLCIAKRSYTEAHREATYQESRRRSQGAIENFQSQGDELDEKGAQVRRGSDKVDMGRYTPMRDA